MRKIGLAGAVVLGLAGAVNGADAVEGIWQTQVDDGAYAHVTISGCGAKLCGVISRTFNSDGEYDSENLGKPIVWDMVPRNSGKYGDGRIWQPSTDKIFRSKMTMSGDTLWVSGCVAGGLICKKQTWVRVQ